MPRIKKLIIFLLLVCLFSPLAIDAAMTCDDKSFCPGGVVCIENPLCAVTLRELIDALINFIFYLAIGIAPIMIIVAGFYFITAAGEPGKITTAKKIILWTLIGLLVVFCAKGLVELVGKVLEIDIVPK